MQEGDARRLRGSGPWLGLALVSGFCALGYEVLYLRQLTTLLGDVMYVHAALLATFLIGIGAGAKTAFRSPRWLAAFEIGTGAYALIFPVLALWLGAQPFWSGVTGKPLWAVLATAGLIALPSFFIGFSLPLFSAYLKSRVGDRPGFRRVYTAYNFGAFAGVLVVELVLIRGLGISGTSRVLGLANIAVGGALLLAGSARLQPPREQARRFARGLILALALASVASAVFQMFLLKLTFLVFQPHRENFAVALAVILLGISLGSALTARVRIRFDTALLILGLTLPVTYLAFGPILDVHDRLADWAGSSDLLIFSSKMAVLAVLGLPVMALFGSLVPALMREERAVAEESGQLLWVSSTANALGYLAFVFIVYPKVSGGVLLALVVFLSLAASRTARPWGRMHSGTAVVAVTAALVLMLVWSDRNFHLSKWRDTLRRTDEVLVFKSGAESATLVRQAGREWVSYNGHPSITVREGGVVNLAETMSGVIPALSAPSLDRALVLGLGTGITGGSVAQIFAQVDIVEINGAFLRMLPELRSAHLDLDTNPAAALYWTDGRAFLGGHEGHYDAIVNSIPSPTYYSASKIYTLEFYRQVERALRPGGVFATWLSATDMSVVGLNTLLSTIRQVFPYCDLRVMRRDYYMATCSTGSLETREYSELGVPIRLERRFLRAYAGLDLDRLFQDLRISANIFAANELGAGTVNTDDFPVLEFQVVRHQQRGEAARNLFLEEADLFGVDLLRRESAPLPSQLAHRVESLRRVDAGIFQTYLLPVLNGDAELMQEWERIRGQR